MTIAEEYKQSIIHLTKLKKIISEFLQLLKNSKINLEFYNRKLEASQLFNLTNLKFEYKIDSDNLKFFDLTRDQLNTTLKIEYDKFFTQYLHQLKELREMNIFPNLEFSPAIQGQFTITELLYQQKTITLY